MFSNPKCEIRQLFSGWSACYTILTELHTFKKTGFSIFLHFLRTLHKKLLTKNKTMQLFERWIITYHIQKLFLMDRLFWGLSILNGLSISFNFFQRASIFFLNPLWNWIFSFPSERLEIMKNNETKDRKQWS
jgi:hypothetical protein